PVRHALLAELQAAAKTALAKCVTRYARGQLQQQTSPA
ncbi:MAG: hypothetical protein RLZZ584_83, partial [Pseudomonadota bacterium]